MSHQRVLDNRQRGAQTVVVSRDEYDRLRAMASRFEMMRNLFELEFFVPPPIRDAGVVIEQMKKTGKYNKEFLRSLKQGLASSDYFRKIRSR